MDEFSVQLWDLILKLAPLDVQLKARATCKLLRTTTDYHLSKTTVPKLASLDGREDVLLHTLPVRVRLDWNKVDWRYARVSHLVAALELNACTNGWLVAVDRINYASLRELVLHGAMSVELDLSYLSDTLILDRLVISGFSLDKISGAVKGTVAETEIRACKAFERDVTTLVPGCKNWRIINNIGRWMLAKELLSTLYVSSRMIVRMYAVVNVHDESPFGEEDDTSGTRVMIYKPYSAQVGLQYSQSGPSSGVELLVVYKPHLPLVLYDINLMFPNIKAILHVQTLGRGLFFENLVLFDPVIDVAMHPIYCCAVIPDVDFDFSKPSNQGVPVPEIVRINAPMIQHFVEGLELEELDLTTIKIC